MRDGMAGEALRNRGVTVGWRVEWRVGPILLFGKGAV